MGPPRRTGGPPRRLGRRTSDRPAPPDPPRADRCAGGRSGPASATAVRRPGHSLGSRRWPGAAARSRSRCRSVVAATGCPCARSPPSPRSPGTRTAPAATAGRIPDRSAGPGAAPKPAANAAAGTSSRIATAHASTRGHVKRPRQLIELSQLGRQRDRDLRHRGAPHRTAAQSHRKISKVHRCRTLPSGPRVHAPRGVDIQDLRPLRGRRSRPILDPTPILARPTAGRKGQKQRTRG
jgi:hypothetical protein